MITIIFLVMIGVIVVGFLLWAVGFGGMKRRGQAPQTQLNAQQMSDTEKRGSQDGL